MNFHNILSIPKKIRCSTFCEIYVKFVINLAYLKLSEFFMISFSVAKYSLSSYLKEELKNGYRRVIATTEGVLTKAICSNTKGHLHPYSVAFNGFVY